MLLIHQHLLSIVPKNVCACGLSVCVHHPMLYRGGLEREGGSEIEFTRNSRHTLPLTYMISPLYQINYHTFVEPPPPTRAGIECLHEEYRPDRQSAHP
jgi:hypothetical protein